MSGDILQQIDATVDDAREAICACGCGVALTSASPSLYYASAQCQEKVARAQAIDADEVANRPDHSMYTESAALLYGDASHSGAAPTPAELLRLIRQARHEQRSGSRGGGWWAPATEPDPHMLTFAGGRLDPGSHTRWYGTPGGPAQEPRVPSPSRLDRARWKQILTFRRACEQCRQVLIPEHSEQGQTCGGCGRLFAHRVYPDWEYNSADERIVLSVQSEGRFTQTTYRRVLLEQSRDPERIITVLFLKLTADLLGFGPQPWRSDELPEEPEEPQHAVAAAMERYFMSRLRTPARMQVRASNPRRHQPYRAGLLPEDADHQPCTGWVATGWGGED